MADYLDQAEDDLGAAKAKKGPLPSVTLPPTVVNPESTPGTEAPAKAAAPAPLNNTAFIQQGQTPSVADTPPSLGRPGGFGGGRGGEMYVPGSARVDAPPAPQMDADTQARLNAGAASVQSTYGDAVPTKVPQMGPPAPAPGPVTAAPSGNGTPTAAAGATGSPSLLSQGMDWLNGKAAEVKADTAAAGVQSVSPTQTPNVTKIMGKDGVPIYTNVVSDTLANLKASGGKNATGGAVSSISDDAFTHPPTGLGGINDTPEMKGRDTRGSGTPSVTDDGDDERRSILNTLMKDRADRSLQLKKFAGLADHELQAGHKRRAAEYVALANTFDKGTPDYAPFARWSHQPTPQSAAQQQFERSRAGEQDAQADLTRTKSAQQKNLLDLQTQAANEPDMKKRAAILDRIDSLSGQHGRRYQFPQVVSGYDDSGRPMHKSYKADTYTGAYEELPGLPAVSQ